MQTSHKLIITLIMFIAHSFILSGQGWIHPSQGHKMLTTEDGNFLGYGFEVTKTDAEANVIWTTSLGSSVYNIDTTDLFIEDAYEMPDGHFVIAGTVTHFHYTSVNNKYVDFTNGYIAEISETGAIIWDKELALDNATIFDKPIKALPVEDGFFFYGETRFLTDEGVQDGQEMLLIKTTETGDVIWRRNYNYIEEGNEHGEDMINVSDNTIMLLGSYSISLVEAGLVLININQDGEIINDTIYDGFLAPALFSSPKIVQTLDGGFCFGQSIPFNALNFFDFSSVGFEIVKINAQGTIEWTDTSKGSFQDIILSPQGDIVILGDLVTETERADDILLRKYTPTGEVVWSREIGGGGNDIGESITLHPDGGYLFFGVDGNFDLLTGLPNNSRSINWFKTDSLGFIFPNNINGTVYEDFDLACEYNGEEGFAQWIVGIETNDEVDFTVTDNNGYYDFSVEDGEYTVFINNKAPYWSGCNDPFTTEVMAYETITSNLGQQANQDCPYLEVDISAPFLRRCFENVYTVSYCNRGTILAEDAYVEVSLDTLLTYVSSTLTLVSNIDNVLTFDLGDVDMNVCGDFKITVLVDCDNTVLGQTHCTTAHIYPDSLCKVNELWSGASIDINANCLGDSIQFMITNVGDVATSEVLSYFIVQDQVILLQGDFPNIDSGADEMITIPSTGATFRMEMEQEPNHPGSNMPTVTVEGCSTDPENISLGFVTQYWENDGDPFVSIDCQENIGSFDPNDKRAYPKGYGVDHLIEKNQDIEYHIRFQNTGSDTAFTVAVRDIISEHLDITSIRPGASSHPYTMDIDDGRVLQFTFPNINLLDSLNNESESHGFIKFKIKQIADLSDGIVIKNTAAIVFDFNEAVITNTAFHTIGRVIVTSLDEVVNQERSELIQVQPNPFSDQTEIRLDLNVDQFPVSLYVFDALGREVRQDVYSTNTIRFDRKELLKGVYFFKILSEKNTLGQGTFIVQ